MHTRYEKKTELKSGDRVRTPEGGEPGTVTEKIGHGYYVVRFKDGSDTPYYGGQLKKDN